LTFGRDDVSYAAAIELTVVHFRAISVPVLSCGVPAEDGILAAAGPHDAIRWRTVDRRARRCRRCSNGVIDPLSRPWTNAMVQVLSPDLLAEAERLCPPLRPRINGANPWAGSGVPAAC